MKESIHNQAYLAALNASQTELGEILAKFELLEARRERMQKVTEALRPLIEAEQQIITPIPQQVITPIHQAAVASPEPISDPTDPHYFMVQNPVESAPIEKEQVEIHPLDSLQRRISSALGMANVA